MKKYLLAGLAFAALSSGAALASGIWEGFPFVGPGVYNIKGYERVALDTRQAQGVNPETVAATPFALAAISAGFAANTATESANAVTLSKLLGTITTSALTTAAGGTYAITVTNTLVTALSSIQAAVFPVSATAGSPVILSIVPGAGSFVLTLKNAGTAALNGTLAIPVQVAPL
jgi:hypothetical protein